jgi:hypothetical protein
MIATPPCVLNVPPPVPIVRPHVIYYGATALCRGALRVRTEVTLLKGSVPVASIVFDERGRSTAGQGTFRCVRPRPSAKSATFRTRAFVSAYYAQRGPRMATVTSRGTTWRCV